MKRAKYIVLTTALVSSIAMGNASMALASEVTDLPEVQEELAEIPEDDALSVNEEDEDNDFFLETEISEEEGMEEASVPVEESERQMQKRLFSGLSPTASSKAGATLACWIPREAPAG